MGKHTNLSTMMSFVAKHVREHFSAYRPRLSPTVSLEYRNPFAPAIKRFGEHPHATRGALSKCGTSLFRRTAGAIELGRNGQMVSREPYPFATNVVHVREDRGDRANAAGWFAFPDGRVKMTDEKLVHAIIGGEDAGRGWAEWIRKRRYNPG